MSKKEKFDIIRIIIGIIILIPLLIFHFAFPDLKIGEYEFELVILLPIAIITYIFLSYDFYIKAFKQILKKDVFNETFLMLVASIAAFIVLEFVEGLAVVLFFQIGEKFEEYALNKSRKSIQDVMDLRSDKVTLFKDDKEIDIDPFDANIGDIFVVKNSERVPLDGVVIKGESFIDTSSLTGESVPRKIKENDEILSGVINKGQTLYIKATKAFYDSTSSKIMDMVENATNTKTKNEKFITRFSKIYTPVVLLIALFTFLLTPFLIDLGSFEAYKDISTWGDSLYNAASILIVSCPCAIVLSIPMAYFVGIGECSKRQLLIKGSTYLEDLAHLKHIILDKTGTITKGNFKVYRVNPVNISKKELLILAASCEKESLHPIAQSIKKEINEEEYLDIKDIFEKEGRGISGKLDNEIILVGNEKLLKEENVEFNELDEVGTKIYVAKNNIFLGSILIKDEIKEDSKEAILNFKKDKIKTYLLTGDNEEFALEIKNVCQIDKCYSSLLPLDKVEITKKIKTAAKKDVVAFIGDGMNDAPSMAVVNTGISMGLIGSDAAIEASDIVVMDDKLSKVNVGRKIAKRTLKVVYENTIFAILIKVAAIVIATSGILGNYMMWLSIFADTGVLVLCVLNSLRLMAYKKY